MLPFHKSNASLDGSQAEVFNSIEKSFSKVVFFVDKFCLDTTVTAPCKVLFLDRGIQLSIPANITIRAIHGSDNLSIR